MTRIPIIFVPVNITHVILHSSFTSHLYFVLYKVINCITMEWWRERHDSFLSQICHLLLSLVIEGSTLDTCVLNTLCQSGDTYDPISLTYLSRCCGNSDVLCRTYHMLCDEVRYSVALGQQIRVFSHIRLSLSLSTCPTANLHNTYHPF